MVQQALNLQSLSLLQKGIWIFRMMIKKTRGNIYANSNQEDTR